MRTRITILPEALSGYHQSFSIEGSAICVSQEFDLGEEDRALKEDILRSILETDHRMAGPDPSGYLERPDILRSICDRLSPPAGRLPAQVYGGHPHISFCPQDQITWRNGHRGNGALLAGNDFFLI